MLSTLLTLALGVPLASADEVARILRVDGPYVYVSLGADDGVRAGQKVELYRLVSVVDPATGKTLRDTFPAGSGRVVIAGDTLTQVVVAARVATSLRAGDELRLTPKPPPPPLAAAAPAPAAPAPTPAPAPAVASAPAPAPAPAPQARPERVVVTEVRTELGRDEKAFQEAFSTAARQDRPDRINTWVAFLNAFPNSDLASPVRDEVASLRRRRAATPVDASTGTLDVVVTAAPRVDKRTATPVVLSSRNPETIQTATLYYRLVGEETYRFSRMSRQGDVSWVADVPAAAVLPPGVEWFVEARDPSGVVETSGSPMAPKAISVVDTPDPVDTVDRSQVSLVGEYADFYAGTGGADRFWHGEADFLYRLQKGPLYSMRVGGGTYRGTSGDVRELDEARAANRDLEPLTEDVGYNFGYTELEFRLAPVFAVMTRGILGVDFDGLALGGEMRARLGREAGTSVDFGAARIGSIGSRYLIAMNWNTIETVPMMAMVEMTDFPGVARRNGPSLDDYGVRLIYGARYALTDHVELGGRVGWQLRNIDHAGPTAGLQGVFSW